MADIYHQVGVKAGIKNIYDAITTLEGLTSCGQTQLATQKQTESYIFILIT